MLAVVFKCLTCSTFDNITDDLILCNLCGLLADVIPLNLPDRCSAAKGGGREAVREGWREGTRAKPGKRLVYYKTFVRLVAIVTQSVNKSMEI